MSCLANPKSPVDEWQQPFSSGGAPFEERDPSGACEVGPVTQPERLLHCDPPANEVVHIAPTLPASAFGRRKRAHERVSGEG